MARRTGLVSGIAAGLITAAMVQAPTAWAYDSWCDLVETHGPGIAVASEKFRQDYRLRDVDRLNSYYDKVIPQLNSVAYATFWYPNVWGSPDIRADTRDLMGAMANLRDTVSEQRPAADEVQAVDDSLAVLHAQCDGKRGLPPRAGWS